MTYSLRKVYVHLASLLTSVVQNILPNWQTMTIFPLPLFFARIQGLAPEVLIRFSINDSGITRAEHRQHGSLCSMPC